MESKIKERCIYCGGDVYYQGDESLIKCDWCGETIPVMKFQGEMTRMKKAEKENTLIRDQLAEAEKEKEAANDRLFAALSDLGQIRDDQDTLGKVVHLLTEGQGDALQGLEFLKGVSEKLVSSQNDIFAKVSVIQEIAGQLQKIDMAEQERQSVMNDFMLWSQQIREEDAQRLQGIATSAEALIDGQRELAGKVDELKEAADLNQQTLEAFRDQYARDKLEKIQKLYRQAADYQQDRRYDKAEEYYRRMLTEGGEDAEVYWRLIMCHYCLFYEKDGEGRMIPIILNPDLTDPAQMSLRKELALHMTVPEKPYYAAKLQEIDRILDKYRLLKDQALYDIFISVKQDDDGHYTADSDVASDLYDFLKGQGLHVFNSRRTAIPAGQEFEPYIISALLSSKVLIVVGTSPENMNSNWVKNEWSRFQWLQYRDKEKTGKTDRVLFCYLAKGMQAEQIPRALHPDRQAIYNGVKAHDQLLAGISSLKGITLAGNTGTVVQSPGDQDFRPVEDQMKFWLIQGKYEKVMTKYNELTEAGLFLAQAQLHLLALCAEKQAAEIEQVVCSDVILDQEAEFKAAIMLCRSDVEKEKLQKLLEKNQEWRSKGQTAGETKAPENTGKTETIETQQKGEEEQISENTETEEWLNLGAEAEEKGELEEAAKWYRKAAEAGDARAQYCLAALLILENDDFEAASEWYRKAAEAGDPDAMDQLAEIYRYGFVGPEDQTEADKWHKKAYEAYRAAAEAGDPSAQCSLGTYYSLGFGVPADKTEAAKWYKKAAEQDYISGYILYGNCLAEGEGVRKNEAEAFTWYKKAVEADPDGPNCLRIGECYENGTGVRKNKKEAAKWYKKAVDQDFEPAREYFEKLSSYYVEEIDSKDQNKDSTGAADEKEPDPKAAEECLQYGMKLEASKDFKEAVKWYRLAAKQGLAEAQYRLALCYENGTGVRKATKAATDWYQKAAEQGHELAKEKLESNRDFANDWFHLGKEAEEKEEYDEALKWYKAAAEANHTEAQYALAKFYLYGNVPAEEYDNEEIAKLIEYLQHPMADLYRFNSELDLKALQEEENAKKALVWCRKAAEAGHDGAQYLLGAVYSSFYVNGLPRWFTALGVKQKAIPDDDKEAWKWFEKAAQAGNPDAQFVLGQCYEKGRLGVSKSKAKAKEWYQKASRQGHKEAEKMLSRWFW